ncbi:MAG: isocitrate/isopropylmalate family dehydrogenase [Gemmatales bacterium]
MQAHLVVLPGDGIGPEVTACAVEVLQAVAKRFGHTFSMEHQLVGGASIDAHGTALTEDTLKTCQKSRRCLAGCSRRPEVG